MSQDQTDELENGSYLPNEVSIEDANAVVVDHEHAKVVSALVGDRLVVYSEDEFTEGKFEHNLIVHGGIATQIGTHIYGDMVVIDARDKHLDALIEDGEPLSPEGEVVE